MYFKLSIREFGLTERNSDMVTPIMVKNKNESLNQLTIHGLGDIVKRISCFPSFVVSDNIYEKYHRTLWQIDFGWLLTSMCNIPENAVVVEVGSAWGCSALAFTKGFEAFNKKEAKLYCIDPWTGTDTESERGYWVNVIAKGPDWFYQQFEDNMKEEGVFDRITPIRKRSADAVNDFEDKSIDFLFLDGDHCYEAVMEELTLYEPKMKINGVIVGHDWDYELLDGSRPVDEAVRDYSFERNYAVINPTTHIWWLVRFDFEEMFSRILNEDRVEVAIEQQKPTIINVHRKET